MTAKLRDFARDIRTEHAAGKTADELRKGKKEKMDICLHILQVHLGTPPEKFDWTFYNKDKKYVAHRGLTPLQFYKEYIPFDVSEYQSLIHDPRNEYNKLYTVKFLGNVVDGARAKVRHLNVDIDTIRKLCVEQLDQKKPVWFGCDVGKEYHRSLAVMDTGLFDYESVYKTTTTLTKKERLEYGQSLMTHAMVFTGYDRTEGAERPNKWRVENSWGTDRGDKGFYMMTDGWFDEYLYQIVAPKSMLSDELKRVITQDDIYELPPWDPMGALAPPKEDL